MKDNERAIHSVDFARYRHSWSHKETKTIAHAHPDTLMWVVGVTHTVCENTWLFDVAWNESPSVTALIVMTIVAHESMCHEGKGPFEYVDEFYKEIVCPKVDGKLTKFLMTFDS